MISNDTDLKQFHDYLMMENFQVPTSGRWKQIGYSDWDPDNEGFYILLDGKRKFVPYVTKLEMVSGMVALKTKTEEYIIHEYGLRKIEVSPKT